MYEIMNRSTPRNEQIPLKEIQFVSLVTYIVNVSVYAMFVVQYLHALVVVV